jgi:hypothetical protein
MYIGLRSILISVRKLHDLPFILCYELNIQCTNLKRRWLDLFCNFYYIQCGCISFCSTCDFLVVIFHFGTSKLRHYIPLRLQFIPLRPSISPWCTDCWQTQEAINYITAYNCQNILLRVVQLSTKAPVALLPLPFYLL